MIRHLAFLALLIISTLYALARGGRPEHIGAVALLGGALLSVLAARPLGPRFRHIETGILIIDMVLLCLFLWLSLRSTRFWPIWISALLGAEVLVHIARATAPDVVPEAYMDAVALWSWVAQAILVAATRRHQTRLRTQGADISWKRSSA